MVGQCTMFLFFFFQAEDGIRDLTVTGVQTCALPIWTNSRHSARHNLEGLPERQARRSFQLKAGAHCSKSPVFNYFGAKRRGQPAPLGGRKSGGGGKRGEIGGGPIL